LVENNELNSEGANFFVQQDIQQLLQASPEMDSILLACTHYPLLLPLIQKYVPEGINIISQGKLVAESLVDYLKRHPEVEEKCSKEKSLQFFTTDDPEDFNEKAEIFFGKRISSNFIKV